MIEAQFPGSCSTTGTSFCKAEAKVALVVFATVHPVWTETRAMVQEDERGYFRSVGYVLKVLSLLLLLVHKNSFLTGLGRVSHI